MRTGGFFFELRRRRVWRVAGAYAFVVWMVVEVVLETGPVLGLPEWVSRAVVLLAFIGFPVTLVLAWIFDITSHGVVRTPSMSAGTAEERGPAMVHGSPGDRARLAGVFGAGMIVALVGFGAYAAIQPTPLIRPETIQAVAVLPLSDLSPEGDQAYFTNGITEELINRLARVPELRVVGRTSAFALREQGAGLAEIARQLRVDAVVEGSVRRSGDRLRVNVELVDATTGFQIWSETYDRTVEDIFAIQDEISGAIVDALRVQLLPGASRHRAGTESVRAHDAYLLGLSHWHARSEEDLLEALEYFGRAIEEDPSYAPARAGLALTYAVLPWYNDIPSELAADRGLEAAARALALDAQNAEAHAAIGQIAQALEWDLLAAETAYRHALEVQPSYATGHQWYAETLLLMGRLGEARHEIATAMAIDPLSVVGQFIQAYLEIARRDLDAAVTAYQRLIAANPGYRLAHIALVDLCLAADCHDIAATAVGEAYPPAVAAALQDVITADRAAYELSEDREALRAAALARLRLLTEDVAPTRLALFHAALGDTGLALDRLEQAYAEGEDPGLLFALVHPLFDGIRREPRFLAITRGIGVETPLAR